MYFDHIIPKAPPTFHKDPIHAPLLLSCFIFLYNLPSPVSCCTRMYWSMGIPLVAALLKKPDSPRSHQLPIALQLGLVLLGLLLHSCWHIDRLDLVQVLCR